MSPVSISIRACTLVRGPTQHGPPSLDLEILNQEEREGRKEGKENEEKML